MKKINSFILFSAILSYSVMMHAQSLTYKISNKIKLDGDGGWDYLIADESAGRLYVSHGTVVQVINLKTQQLMGTIPDTKGVHGIALAKKLDKGFASNGKDGSVTIFNLSTLKTLMKVKITGENPDAILYDPFSDKVFVYNGKSNNATVINANTDSVIATIELEGKPEFSVSDGKGKVYVNIEDKSKICVINATTLKIEQTWPVSPGEEPSGLALDNNNHRLFTVCDNKLMVVINALNGKLVASLPIGEGVDGVVFDPDKERIYSSNGDGTLTVVQGENGGNYKVIENITTQKGARTITLDKNTHHVYLPVASYGAPPAPTPENPKPRPAIKPGSFVVLDVEPVK